MSSRWGRGVSACVALSMLCVGCGKAADNAERGCKPFSVAACACNDGTLRMTTCVADGTHFEACTCSSAISSAGSSGSGLVATPVAGIAAPGFPAAGSGGLPAMMTPFPAGVAAPPVAGVGLPGTAGRGFAGVGAAGVGAAGVGAAGKPASAGTSGASGAGGSGTADFTADELAMLRQTCVDEINMYRATLPNLKVLKRASAAQEMCSDKGAQMDGDSGQAHGSARAGLCTSVGLGSEDTCPGWGVGGRSGNATVADALKGCLKSMWGEGEPPVSRAMCEQDYAGCFEKYGHYLNMSDPGVGSVACSFYHMKNGQWWMNQDFAY